jgi:NSS family neurotransmitter:Na+ symporter
MQGLAYYLDPVWSELAKPITWRYAFGQVFFSLSLAFGVMITYASFLHRKSDLNNNAAIIGIADFATSFVAGLAVFATLGGMAYATQQAGYPVPIEGVAGGGPSLAFVAFPYALAQLPYSAWFSFVFFFALVTLGIDSAFSITESILASIVDKTGWRRNVVLPVMSLVGLLFGIVYVTKGGLNWLGTIDGFVNGTWGIALLGLIECVVLGWLWRIDTLRRHANSRSDWRLGKWWEYLIRIVIPIVLGTLFFWQLFDDFTNEGGFLRTPEGEWIIPNCVGTAVVTLAPVLAVLFSIYRGRCPIIRTSEPMVTKGNRLGIITMVISIMPVFIALFMGKLRQASDWVILWPLLLGGIVAVALAIYVVDRSHTRMSEASWFARWAGIIGTMDIAAYIAYRLFAVTSRVQAETKIATVHHELGEVSYIILSVVFLLIIGGLGWCFYKALAAAGITAEMQEPGEVGDEEE